MKRQLKASVQDFAASLGRVPQTRAFRGTRDTRPPGAGRPGQACSKSLVQNHADTSRLWTTDFDTRPDGAAVARIGYSRVSTLDQHPEVQSERLREAGCTRIFEDHGQSGAKASRPEWDRCLDRLEAGDTLVAVRLDRIGRSTKN